jgi:hypothetical protein
MQNWADVNCATHDSRSDDPRLSFLYFENSCDCRPNRKDRSGIAWIISLLELAPNRRSMESLINRSHMNEMTYQKSETESPICLIPERNTRCAGCDRLADEATISRRRYYRKITWKWKISICTVWLESEMMDLFPPKDGLGDESPDLEHRSRWPNWDRENVLFRLDWTENGEADILSDGPHFFSFSRMRFLKRANCIMNASQSASLASNCRRVSFGGNMINPRRRRFEQWRTIDKIRLRPELDGQLRLSSPYFHGHRGMWLAGRSRIDHIDAEDESTVFLRTRLSSCVRSNTHARQTSTFIVDMTYEGFSERKMTVPISEFDLNLLRFEAFER